MSVDIRTLLEKLSNLSKAPLKEQAQGNVVPLPLKAPKIDPGTHSFGQMGQVLTKPKPEEPVKPPAITAKSFPGQKTLPGFGISNITPETPAYIPKQPWLDPTGSKEPAYMRRAAGVTPPQPLGVIGGTGPDAKFDKAPAANEPKIPKQPSTATNIKPSAKIKLGSEYSNVYSTAKGLDGKPSFADVQYAKDVQRELEKTPDDPNLKAELELLQNRGIVQKPQTQAEPRKEVDVSPDSLPQTQPAQDELSPGRLRSAIPPVVVPPVVPSIPTADTDDVGPLRSLVGKNIKEFKNFLDVEFPLKKIKLKEQTKGPIKPGAIPLEFPPGGTIATPGPVPRIPSNVNVPAYQRALQPSAAPQGVEVPAGPKPRLAAVGQPSQAGTGKADAANAPLLTPPKVFKQHPERVEKQAQRRSQELGTYRPGEDKPIATPQEKPLIPKPELGTPGSVIRQRRKLIPPAAIIGATGGGGKEGSGSKDSEPSSITTQPVELWRDQDIPKSIEKPIEQPADISIEPTPPVQTPTQQASQPSPAAIQKTKPTVTPSIDKEKSKGAGGGVGGGTGTGIGVGSGSRFGGDGDDVGPLGSLRKSTNETASKRFYSAFKEYILNRD